MMMMMMMMMILIGAFISISISRTESFETCCQWALLSNVQIITLPFTFTVQKYILPSCLCMLGLFVSVIHRHGLQDL